MVEEYQSANAELLWLVKRARKLMANKRIEKISLCKVGRFHNKSFPVIEDKKYDVPERHSCKAVKGLSSFDDEWP